VRTERFITSIFTDSKTLQEAFDIGYEEYFYSNDYCLVEWPQKVDELLPDKYIKVEAGDYRRFWSRTFTIYHDRSIVHGP
jgi:tRNA A37 threonylcarbamoyladenosine biosynthesis protein TsaE